VGTLLRPQGEPQLSLTYARAGRTLHWQGQALVPGQGYDVHIHIDPNGAVAERDCRCPACYRDGILTGIEAIANEIGIKREDFLTAPARVDDGRVGRDERRSSSTSAGRPRRRRTAGDPAGCASEPHDELGVGAAGSA